MAIDTHDRGVPDSAAARQDRTLEERVAFIEHRLGLIKTIEDHEWDESSQEEVVVKAPGDLYSGPDAGEQLVSQMGDAAPVDVGGKSKEDLQAEAADLDIQGRSSMNKQELAAAIDAERAKQA